MAGAGHEDKVKVNVRYRADLELLAGESLWAVPVVAHDAGGTYRLQNNSFYIPLAVGDVVRAELNGDEILQVVDIVEPAGVILTSVAVHGDTDAARALGDRWRESGATWSEGMDGLLSTVWGAGVDVDRVLALLAPDVLAGRGELLWVAGPEQRTGAAQTAIDFELDRVQHFPPVETSYWAADDPYWRELGLDSPDFLAYLQSLAGRDARLAAALEDGDYDTAPGTWWPSSTTARSGRTRRFRGEPAGSLKAQGWPADVLLDRRSGRDVAGVWQGQAARHRRDAPPPRPAYDEVDANRPPWRLMLFLVLAVLILSMVPWLGQTTGLISEDAPSAPAPTCAGGVVCQPATR